MLPAHKQKLNETQTQRLAQKWSEAVEFAYERISPRKRPKHVPDGQLEKTSTEFDRINSKGLISEAYVYFYHLAGLRQQLGLNPHSLALPKHVMESEKIGRAAIIQDNWSRQRKN